MMEMRERRYPFLFVFPVLWMALTGVAAAAPSADNMSTYRGFAFGATLAATAKKADKPLDEVKTVHKRPVLIQELDWRPQFSYEPNGRNPDPVHEVLLRFYDGTLFQMVVTYDSRNVEGMSTADMVEAISKTYGKAETPGGELLFHSNYGETTPLLAHWSNGEYTADLVRTGDQTSYALVLSLGRIDVKAQAAQREALRLDQVEAPEREARQQSQADSERAKALSKAREQNKPKFRP